MQHARSLSLKYDNYWGPMTVETLINGVVLLCTTLLHSSISTKPATKEALFFKEKGPNIQWLFLKATTLMLFSSFQSINLGLIPIVLLRGKKATKCM